METIKHFVTVISCCADEDMDGGFTEESYKEAQEYTKSFLQERLDKREEEIIEKLYAYMEGTYLETDSIFVNLRDIIK